MYAFETSTLASQRVVNEKKNQVFEYELRYSPMNDFSETLFLDYFQDGVIKGHVQYINGTPLYCERDSTEYKKALPITLQRLINKLENE